MKKKFLVFALVATLFMIFSVGSANAIWQSNASVDNIGVTPTGNYTFSATVGSWTKSYTILSSDANAKAMLALLLSAQATGYLISIDFSGSTINGVYSISP